MALAGTLLALTMTGCSAPAPTPTPTEPAPQTPPPAAVSTPTPAPGSASEQTAVEVQAMSDLWESAPPEQREDALRVIGLDPADPQPTDDAVETLVSKAAELGYVVSEDAARQFLAQISGD